MKYSIAYKTIVTKEIRRFTRIWPQTVLPPVITTSLYFLIFGKLIGSRIGSMDGHSYMEYIVPGIILMAVINNSYSNVVSSFYSTKFQRQIEELLIAPVPNWIILAGYVSGGVARGLMVGSIVAIISNLFSEMHIQHYGIAIGVMLLTATLFSLAGFVNATFANSFDDISIIPNFVLTPLIYLGGVFYSISLLPGLWQHVSLVNPIFYMVNAFRYGVLGVSDIEISVAFVIIIAFNLVLAIASLIFLNKGVGIKS